MNIDNWITEWRDNRAEMESTRRDYIGDIVAVEVYKNDVVVKRKGRNVDNEGASTRGEVAEFSEKSRRRLAFIASNTDVDLGWMITLTYPDNYPSNGLAVKSHLRAFMRRLKRRNEGIEYLWFIEFQARGAPHYHILLNMDITGQKEKVSKDWYQIVGSEDEKHLKAGTRCEKMRVSGARYAVKYAMKMRQKRVPHGYRDVGRFWGHSKAVKPEVRLWQRDGMSDKELSEILEGWEYKNRAVKGKLNTLYNASAIVSKNVEALRNE